MRRIEQALYGHSEVNNLSRCLSLTVPEGSTRQHRWGSFVRDGVASVGSPGWTSHAKGHGAAAGKSDSSSGDFFSVTGFALWLGAVTLPLRRATECGPLAGRAEGEESDGVIGRSVGELVWVRGWRIPSIADAFVRRRGNGPHLVLLDADGCRVGVVSQVGRIRRIWRSSVVGCWIGIPFAAYDIGYGYIRGRRPRVLDSSLFPRRGREIRWPAK